MLSSNPPTYKNPHLSPIHLPNISTFFSSFLFLIKIRLFLDFDLPFHLLYPAITTKQSPRHTEIEWLHHRKLTLETSMVLGYWYAVFILHSSSSQLSLSSLVIQSPHKLTPLSCACRTNHSLTTRMPCSPSKALAGSHAKPSASQPSLSPSKNTKTTPESCTSTSSKLPPGA